MNLLRVSKIKPNDPRVPFAKSSFYKFHHINRYPGLFVKLGSALYIDLNYLDDVIEQGRLKK
jgi:hypothetical protein